MPYKICHFTSVHPRYDTRIFSKECRTLVEAGFEVYLVVADNKPDENQCDIKILSTGTSETNRLNRIFNVSRKVSKKAIQLKADLYHFHDPELLPFAWYFMFKGERIIYDIHENVPDDIHSKAWIWKPIRSIISFSVRALENVISRRMTYLIAATPYIESRFKRMGANVINLNNYPWLHELSSDQSWNFRQNRICYIGGISYERGFKELVESLNHVEDVILEVGGTFETVELESETKSNSAWNKVIYHGYVNRKQAKEIMSRCRAGIVTFHPYPNHINAQPNKIFEYMSAGLPVIGSNFPLWKKLIEENNCGICVDPLDPYDIANGINTILKNSDASSDMSREARRKIETTFKWENEESKLIELYNKILESN